MAIYKVIEDRFVSLERTSYEQEKVYEVTHLQKFLTNSIEVIGEDLLVISTEYSNWEDSSNRIDILCVDKEANLVVVELKRTQNGGHMELQALRYAAMVANMTYEHAIQCYEKHIAKYQLSVVANESLDTFLEGKPKDDFGKKIRIILVSADFGVELTTSVLWLNEQNLDITCFKIGLQKDNEALYYDIQQIIPLPEAHEFQVKMKEKIEEERQVRKENSREQSIVLKLYDRGVIKDGDKFILKPAIEQGVNQEEVTATLTRRGSNCLLYEGHLYSFSSLRGVLAKKFNLKDVKPEWGFGMRLDWMNENGKTLEELDL